MKDLKDFTWEDLQTYCTWRLMEEITKGTPLKSAVWSVIDLTLMWKRAQDEKTKKKPNKQNGKRTKSKRR
jgi:hypothetical protein